MTYNTTTKRHGFFSHEVFNPVMGKNNQRITQINTKLTTIQVYDGGNSAIRALQQGKPSVKKVWKAFPEEA